MIQVNNKHARVFCAPSSQFRRLDKQKSLKLTILSKFFSKQHHFLFTNGKLVLCSREESIFFIEQNELIKMTSESFIALRHRSNFSAKTQFFYKPSVSEIIYKLRLQT